MPWLHAIINGMYGKNLSTLHTFCHDDIYKLRLCRRSFRTLPKKFQRVEKDEVRFVDVMIVNFEFDF